MVSRCPMVVRTWTGRQFGLDTRRIQAFAAAQPRNLNTLVPAPIRTPPRAGDNLLLHTVPARTKVLRILTQRGKPTIRASDPPTCFIWLYVTPLPVCLQILSQYLQKSQENVPAWNSPSAACRVFHPQCSPCARERFLADLRLCSYIRAERAPRGDRGRRAVSPTETATFPA